MIALPAWFTWKAIVAGLSKVPMWAWAALGLAVCLMVARSHWIDVGADRVQAEWDAQKAADALIVEQAAKDAREQEAREKKANQAAADKLKRDNANALKERDDTIAALRRGDIRLQKRFTCPRAVPATAGSPAGSDGAGEAGLLAADAEFLVRFANEADTVVNRLTACQAVLAAERE